MTGSAALPSILDAARDGNGSARVYRRGNLIIGAVWGISSLLLVKLVIWGTVEVARTSDPQGLLEAVAASDHAPYVWLGFLAALIGFVPLAVVVPMVIERLHRRSWRTSFTPYLTIDKRQILWGAVIMALLYGLVVLFAGLLLRGSVTTRFDLAQFLPGVAVLATLLGVQAFGQELFFRGYCLQWSSLDFSSRRTLAAISGVAFGLPFVVAPWIVQWFVPEVQVPDHSVAERVLLTLGYIGLGAALAMATLRTGTIEFAVGGAFSVNLLTALVLSPRVGQLAGGSVLEIDSGVGPTAVYVALLGVAVWTFAKLAGRLTPDPGRPTLRDTDPRGVLALPAGDPIWRVSLRGLLSHRLRLVLTLLTITLGVTFVTATLVFSDTTSKALDSFFQQPPADVVVEPDDPVAVFDAGGRPAALTLRQDLADRLRDAPGVERIVSAVNQEGVSILTPQGVPAGGPSSARVGASWTPEQLPAGTADLVADLPRGPDQVMIDTTTASRLGISPGDSVRLVTPRRPDPTKLWVVTGTLDIGLAGGATVAVFDLPTAQRLITGPGRVNQLLVTVAPGSDPATVARTLNDRLGDDSPVVARAGREVADRNAAQVAGDVGFLNTLLTVFAGIALVAAGLLIANTFTMLVAQRHRELALLRAVGAGSVQLQAGVVAQAAILGAIGTVLGVALGIYLAVGLRVALQRVDIDVPGGSLLITPWTLLLAATVGVGVTVLAAWVPAARAGQIPPVQAMAIGRRVSRDAQVRRGVLAVLFAAISLLLVIVALRDSFAENGVAWLGLATLAGVAAFVAGAPWLLQPLLAVGSRLLRGVPGRLAIRSIARDPRRATATTAALAIGVAIVALITVLTASIQATADEQIDQTIAADLSIGAPPRYPPFDQSISRRAGAVAGVRSTTAITTTAAQRGDIPIRVFGVDPAAIQTAVRLPVVAGSLDRVAGDRAAIDQRLAERFALQVGSAFSATTRTGQQTVRIVAIYEPVLVFEGLVVDRAAAVRFGAAPGLDTAAYFTVDPGTDPAVVAESMRRVIQGNPLLQVQDQTVLKANVDESLDQLLALVMAMLAVTIVIAVLAIANTVLLSITERTAEIGMLRALGATTAQVRGTLLLEAALLGAIGAGFGIALGLLFGVLFRNVMAPLGITILSIPWWWLLTLGAAGALLGAAAALWPAHRAARQNPLSAIATE